MKNCPKCGKEIKLDSKDKLLRKLVAANAKLFPTLSSHVEIAKDYCNECYKAEVLPAANALVGKDTEPQTT